MTTEATKAREQAHREEDLAQAKKGEPPLPPGFEADRGVNCGIAMLHRIRFIIKQRKTKWE